MSAPADYFYRRLTEHVEKRLRQRGISREAILAALTFGQTMQGRDAVRYYLRRRDIPADLAPQIGRYEGLVVVVSRRGDVITAYRQPSGTAVRKAARWQRR